MFKCKLSVLLVTTVLAVIALGSMLAGCRPPSTVIPSPTAGVSGAPVPTSAPTTVPAAQRPPMPPVVVEMSPRPGEEIAPDAPITIVFNEKMDPTSASNALALEPSVPGNVKVEGNELVFHPATTLKPGMPYRLRVSGNLKAANGTSLGRDLVVRFRARGNLEVSSVQPADGATNVAPRSKIVVVFNRPVVPLTTIGGETGFPSPLRIEPEVEGKGEWVNGGVYQFVPSEAMDAGATYTVTVDPSLKDLSGSALAKPFGWHFAVQPPQVLDMLPRGRYIGPTDVFTITFNVPMDHGSVAAHTTLTDMDTNAPVPGTMRWVTDTVAAYVPASPLKMNTSYRLLVKGGALTASGRASLPKASWMTWHTYPMPEVTRTSPKDGEADFDPTKPIRVYILGNIDANSVTTKTVSIEPKPRYYSVWYSRYDKSIGVYFEKKAHTAYTITLSGEIGDVYGHKLGKDYRFSFTTGSYPPSAVPIVSGYVAIYDSYEGAPHLGVRYRSVRDLHLKLYRLDVKEVRTLGNPRSSENPAHLLKSWDYTVEHPDSDEFYLDRIPLTGKGGSTLPDGFYRVSMKYDKHRPEINVVILLTPYNVVLKSSSKDALVWVTDLKTGEPVPDVPLRLFMGGKSIDGRTDSDGVWRVQFEEPRRPWQRLTVLVHPDSPDGYADNNGRAVEGWKFDLPTAYGIPGNYSVDLYTDRPIYRPGQTVHWKAVIRRDQDGVYSLPPAGTVAHVRIFDPQHKVVLSDDYTVDDMGTIHGDFDVEEGASLGHYSLSVALGQHDVYSQPFLVAEYRKPEFQLDVKAGKSNYIQGETVEVQLRATYFFGGPLSNAHVEWNATAHDAPFTWRCPASEVCPNYHFEEPGFWYWFRRSEESWDRTLANGEGTTDANGYFTVTVPADIAKALIAQRLVVEFDVEGSNGLFTAGRTSARIHKGADYVGIAPRSYIYTVGEKGTFDFISVNYAGKILAAQPFTVTVSQEEWHNVRKEANGSVYWETEMVEKPVITETLKTGADGRLSHDFAFPDTGSYLVKVQTADDEGRITTSKLHIWVAGKGYISWPRRNDNLLRMVADREKYSPGDTARVMVMSPYKKAVEALVTVERGGIIDVFRRTLSTNSEIIEIPIGDAYTPNVFVSVVAVQGDRDGPEGLPDTRVGYVELKVSDEKRLLHVVLTPSSDHLQPRQWVTYTLQATDADGKPAVAEFSVAAVDKAVLTLSTEGLHTLRQSFYSERGLGVSTTSSVFSEAEKLLKAAVREMAGKKGGGGGGAGWNVRHYFPDNAYWNAVVKTGEDGRATFSFQVPDNLTTWQVEARGVDAKTRVGEAKSDLVVNLPFMVRPVAPRFFTVGDRPVLAAIVHNNTDKPVQATVRLDVKGADIVGDAVHTVSIQPGQRARLEWPLEKIVGVEGKSKSGMVLKLRWKGSTDTGLRDAVELTPPVYNYSTEEVTATSGEVGPGETVTDGVVLPASGLDRSQGYLEVNLQPSLAVAMLDGLKYLKHYPYECTEQLVSKFLPNLFTYRAMIRNGVENETMKEELKDSLYTSLQKLYHGQHLDGGWGWWLTDAESSPYLTAYVLWGLTAAKENGFDVSDEVMSRAAGYVRAQLRSVSDLRFDYEFHRQAFYIFVLSEAERVTGNESLVGVNRAVNLFDERQHLNYESKALLAMALKTLGGPDEDVQALLSDLDNGAFVSATGINWEEKSPDWWTMNSDTRTTAVVLDALIRLAGDDRRIPMVVRWLMSARKDGHWATTQETAWSLIALSDWLESSGELHPDYSASVSLNSEKWWRRQVTEKDVREEFDLRKAVSDLLEQNVLVFSRKSGEDGKDTGRLYYTMDLRAFRPVDDIEPLNRGFFVQRTYTLASDPKKPISEAHVGDIIDVKITLILPQTMHFVMVEDPIPAGTEPMNLELETTTRRAAGPSVKREKSPWWFWVPQHVEMHDERVSLFSRWMRAGTYEFHYQVRASLPGRYLVAPTVASEMYFPEVFGRTGGSAFEVKP